MGFNEPRSQLVGFNTRPPSILQAASVLVRMSSLLLALFTFASVTAFSGIDMYLKIPGVDAESVDTNHLGLDRHRRLRTLRIGDYSPSGPGGKPAPGQHTPATGCGETYGQIHAQTERKRLHRHGLQ